MPFGTTGERRSVDSENRDSGNPRLSVAEAPQSRCSASRSGGLGWAQSGYPTHLAGLPCLSVMRPGPGALKPGAVGGAAARSVDAGGFNHVYVLGEMLAGGKKVNVQGVVLAGKWRHPQ